MSFFKPEDFGGVDILIHGVTSTEIANRILTDRGIRVYGIQDIGEWNKFFSGIGSVPHTHQAFLVAIEELPKTECKHEPRIVKVPAGMGMVPMYTGDDSICSKCGIKLRAKWEPV